MLKTFLSLVKGRACLSDDLRESGESSNVVALDLKNNRHTTLISLGSSMLKRGMAFEIVEQTVTAAFESEQVNRTGDDGDELRGILSNLRKKADGDSGEFSDLVRHLPHIQTKQSEVNFSLLYDGSRFEITGFANLRNHNKVIEAVAEQVGRIPNITRARWITMLDDLWQDKRDEIDHSSTEASIEFALWALINKSLRATYEPPWNGARLSIESWGSYVDLDAGRIWYSPAPMLSRLNGTGLGFKCSSHRLMAIVRALGGGAESHRVKIFSIKYLGTDKQKVDERGTTSPYYMHWLPCPSDVLDELRGQFSESKFVGYMPGNLPGQLAQDASTDLTVGGEDAIHASGSIGDTAQKVLSDNTARRIKHDSPY